MPHSYVTGSLIPSFHSTSVTKESWPNLSQLNAAAMGILILHDLVTIDQLVDLLSSTVEDDKFLIHLGLERGRDGDRHPIHEVVKQLKKNRGKLFNPTYGSQGTHASALLLSTGLGVNSLLRCTFINLTVAN